MPAERTWSGLERAALRRVLADLFPREPDQRRFVSDLELEERTIEFHASAENTWFSILRRAEQTIGLNALLRHTLATDEGRHSRDLRRIAEGGCPTDEPLDLSLESSLGDNFVGTHSQPRETKPTPVRIQVDSALRENVGALCDKYVWPLHAQLIGDELKALPGAEKLLGADGLPMFRRVLVTGGAGGGKSSELAHLVERLRKANVPTLPVRLDQVEESVRTPQQLGDALSLPASPVTALAELASGSDGVLVVDQLDAVSLVSGRRAALWALFEGLLAEAERHPNLRVVVACRQFDLEHDHRMRSLTAKRSTFEVVSLGPFSPKQLDEILGERKVHPKLKPLLVVPLHLAMFFSLPAGGNDRLETRDDLFNAFWLEKRKRTSERLGRPFDFWGVVDKLTAWLSERQELSAPDHVLHDVLPDAEALTSERVLVLADNRYRFFHETFFDYAFAHRFARNRSRLIDLLMSEEQHLFRRAQVRQVLSYLRSRDFKQYIGELRSVLTDGRVRFHIKRVVLQYLSALTDPKQREWEVLQALEAEPALHDHVYGVIINSPGWFDTLDAAGVFDGKLSSGEASKQQWAVTLLAKHEVLKNRSARVAALLSKHRRGNETWKHYLRYVCQTGDVFYSRAMFDLFLSLIRDGSLDGARPGVAINDDWWSVLYSMAEEAPEMASEVIGVWLDRKLETWQASHAERSSRGHDEDVEKGVAATTSDGGEAPGPAASLDDHLDTDGNGEGIIWKATGAPLAYVEQLLPRVAKIVASHSETSRDCLNDDPLWRWRSFGDNEHQTHATILKALVDCSTSSWT